jgi:oligopeptide/dipeptide ABC transporter ATP-binding protein
MYAGRIVEQGTKRDLFYDPEHPYTWGLLGSIARLDRPRPKRLTAIKGLPPSMLRLPDGCSFGPRCPHRFDRCVEEVPELTDKVGGGHLDACHLAVAQKRERRESAIHPELSEEPA